MVRGIQFLRHGGHRLHLIRDCLDKQLLDQNKRPMGRVDGIILVVEPNRQPRVGYIEVGAMTLADRISPRLRQLLIRVMKRFRIRSERYRLPWGRIRVGLAQVTAQVEAETTPALEWELWLRKHVLRHIPGA